MLLVILTLAVQSIHIYYHQHHLIEIDHVCDGNHDHHDHEDCHVCDFVFSFFVCQPFFFHPFPEKFNPKVSDGLALNKPILSDIHAYPKRGPPMKW